jgi:hypothetical protein
MDACFAPVTENMILLSGPRWAAKTFACHHAVCQHAWDTDRGNICLLAITQSVGVDSGIWQHLTEIFLPEWINAGFGMHWVREPYVQHVTKKPCCIVSNRHGNQTRITLESLKNEDEVEHRFKGRSYSMIWINELSKFKKRATFTALKQQLREPHLQSDDMLFLADTNPDLDQGVQSWIYKLWYEFKKASPEDIEKLYPDLPASDFVPLQNALKLIEFTVDDNLSLSDEKKAQLRADFAHNDTLLQAYYYGKWVTAASDALFFDVFRPLFHAIPEFFSGSEDQEIMVPEDGCTELQTGWDPGGRNCAAVITEKAFRIDQVEIEGKLVEKVVPVMKVLDELVIVGQDFDLHEFVEDMVLKMRFWEKVIGSPVLWRHWSDRMVFDMRVPFSDRYWHQHIFDASDGVITLMAADFKRGKGAGSVALRVELTRKMLFQERLFVSRVKCPAIIDMLKTIRKGKGQRAIDPGDPKKHVFDALTYDTLSELSDELTQSVRLSVQKERSLENSVLSVRF